jgi:hypothetical protein
MTYRQYYFKEAIRTARMALTLLWHGVIMNKGHHSKWRKKNAK